MSITKTITHENFLEVCLDATNGMVEFKGKSIEEDPEGVYVPILNWVMEYGNDPRNVTTVNMFLEYFNTMSSKCIFEFLKGLEIIHSSGKTSLSINWHYEKDDEDMFDAGNDFKSMLKVPVNIIPMDDFSFSSN